MRLKILGTFFLLCFAATCAGADDLERRATWDLPQSERTQLAVTEWLATLPLADDVRQQAQQLWDTTEPLTPAQVVDKVVETAALVDERATVLAQRVMDQSKGGNAIDELLFQDDTLPAVVRHNLQLADGVWLAKNRYYDESKLRLADLSPEQVADPAALLFYQGAAHYRLREKEDGLRVLDRLLEWEDLIPVRFATVAKMMHSDLELLKSDSLDEVARLMDSIHVRLGHGRAGQRVRTEEDEVIEKLDKMIEKLEQQRQQMQQQSSGGGGPGSQPMQDSMLPGMQADGNVDSKKIEGPIDWGSLPPAERQEALQQLSKQFPSHYREVIEEYFRDIARKETDSDKP